MKRTDNYASNQIRILLHELKNPSHKIKVKAIETFRSYIETYQPDVSGSHSTDDDDDDVDCFISYFTHDLITFITS
jgi:hypothetical protein